jgi:hypothetical protein
MEQVMERATAPGAPTQRPGRTLGRLVLPIALAALQACSAGEPVARITGTAAGPGCGRVAVGISRFELVYPLFEMSGWSRGVPTVRHLRAELQVLDTRTGALRGPVTIDAPAAWQTDTRFSVQPRILPDERVILVLHGCPAEQQNCQEMRFFEVQGDRAVALGAWPEPSAEESRNLRECTDRLTYDGNRIVVNTVQAGMPPTPVLVFADRRLSPVSATAPPTLPGADTASSQR